MDNQTYLEQFNYNQLYAKLLDAARKAFVGIQSVARGEDFYAFALFTAGGYPYVCITANTEQGLTRRAEIYLQHDASRVEKWYDGFSLEDMRKRLRHSPADSPYHCLPEYDAFFEDINNMLADHSNAKFEIWSKLSDEPGRDKAFDLTQHYRDKITEVFLKVLQQLDQEYIFGSGSAREKVILNILIGDQDSTYIRYAEILNPPSVFERFLEEIVYV